MQDVDPIKGGYKPSMSQRVPLNFFPFDRTRRGNIENLIRLAKCGCLIHKDKGQAEIFFVNRLGCTKLPIKTAFRTGFTEWMETHGGKNDKP